jgi:hypothetical protein
MGERDSDTKLATSIQRSLDATCSKQSIRWSSTRQLQIIHIQEIFSSLSYFFNIQTSMVYCTCSTYMYYYLFIFFDNYAFNLYYIHVYTHMSCMYVSYDLYSLQCT